MRFRAPSDPTRLDPRVFENLLARLTGRVVKSPENSLLLEVTRKAGLVDKYLVRISGNLGDGYVLHKTGGKIAFEEKATKYAVRC